MLARMRLIALALIALTSIARADTSASVVVTGDDSVKKQVRDVAEAWFAAHELEVTKAPLNKDGLNTLMNCLVMADMTCARGVVEARAKVTNVIVIAGQASGKQERRSIQLAAYWIAKQREVVSVQRTCDACSDEVFTDTLHAVLDDLAKHAPTMNGTLHVTSVPPGLAVTIDSEAAGKTPFDRAVSFGPHIVSIVRKGRVVAQKKVMVGAAASVDVPITVPDDPPPIKIVERHSSRAVPVVLLTVGIAAGVTGGVLYKYGGPTGESYTYRNMRPAGIATGISGGVAIIVGTVWLLRGGSTTSRPEVSVSSSTATVGWARSF